MLTERCRTVRYREIRSSVFTDAWACSARTTASGQADIEERDLGSPFAHEREGAMTFVTDAHVVAEHA